MSSMRWITTLVTLVLCASCTRSERGRDPAAPQADPTSAVNQSDPPTAGVPNIRDLGWMVRNSPFVFVGRLASREAAKDGDLIVTKNRFDVERVIAGDESRKSAQLTLLGGELDGQAMRVSHSPEFEMGARYIIFTDLARTVYNPITGRDGGVYRVTDAGVFTYDGQSVIGVENGAIQLGDASFRPNPERTAATVENPSVGGGVTSAQSAESAAARVLSLEEFAAAVRSAARQ
jgi:hypothetical protein